jgi:hypothetical protein
MKNVYFTVFSALSRWQKYSQSWGTTSEFLCSIFMLYRTLKTEVLRLSKHISTRPMTRRRIPKDAAPLWEPQISQLINMAGDRSKWDLLNTVVNWATVSFWIRAELKVTLLFLADSGRSLQPTKYTQPYFVILQHVSADMALCNENGWYINSARSRQLTWSTAVQVSHSLHYYTTVTNSQVDPLLNYSALVWYVGSC